MALLNTKTAEDFYALLNRLYGDTYGSRNESSVFQRQLRAWSVLLALGRSEIDRAFREAFPDLSDALIEEWERAFNLPNDSARTLAERQARVAAHERTQRGAARADLQDTLDATGVAASFVPNKRDEVLAAGSEAAAIFQSTLQLANEDFYDPIVRSALETLYGNALPAKNVGALDRPGPGFSTCVEVGAAWGSAAHYVGRDALGRQVANVREERAPHARVRSFGPGTRLDAADLNAIQETLLGSALVGEPALTDFVLQAPGLLTRWFGAPASGVATILDDSIDWRDRFIIACYRTDVTDAIVPGDVDDDKWGQNSPAQFRAFYSGTGGGGATYFSAPFQLNGTDLELAASQVVSGIIWATEKLGMR